MKSFYLVFALFLPVASHQAAPAGETFLLASNAKELAGAFASGDDKWLIENSEFGSRGTGEWRYAASKPQGAANYTVEATVHIKAGADRRDGLEMGAYGTYQAHAQLGGYENALCVRYHGPHKHYRVAVSSLWGEIILWRPSGGVVQVREFPFEMGKSYTLKVTVREARIAVAVDGKPLVDWTDTTDPVLDGPVALAVKEGESSWTKLSISEPAPLKDAVTGHRPEFSERQWHGGRWFFDGQEPLFTLREDNVLDHMKLLPGYRAAMYAFNYVTDWNSFYPRKIKSYRLIEQGNRLVIETVAADPKFPAIGCTANLTVSFDPKSGMYIYDHACTIDLPTAEAAQQVAREWDHGDAVFLGSVGTAQTRNSQAPKPFYEWSVFEGPDNQLYKVPHNHNGHYLAAESNNGGPVYPNGGQLVAVGDPILSPVIQIAEMRPEFGACKVGLCWWAYDVHTLFEPKLRAGVLQPGKYVSKVRYTGMAGTKGHELLARAKLYKPLNSDVRIPVYTAGIGEVERFDKVVVLASPHTEHRIWGGEFDSTQGHGDKASLRLEGAAECWTLTGPSYFVSPYGKRNRVSVWVKTDKVEGDGPTIGFRRLDNNTAEFHSLGVRGTTDWTFVSYVTAFPQDSFGVMVNFRNSGTGTVWFDDFQIEPLVDDSKVTDQSVGKPVTKSDLLLDYRPKRDDFLLDASGLGHHGKVYGMGKLVEQDGRPALRLDGETSYIWPLGTPSLSIGPGTTLITEIKPIREGLLVSAGFQFTLSLTGGGEELGVEYRPASGPPSRSKPLLKSGQWQQLAIVFQEDGIQIYVDGRFREKLALKTIRTNWSLHEQSTWHRHLSFFGMGPGNMALIMEHPAYCLQGDLRSLSLIGKELASDEIKAAADRR